MLSYKLFMVSTKHIKQKIEEVASESANIFFKYSRWQIGITSRPKELEIEYQYPKFWRCWRAESEGEARLIESHFLCKGMRSGNKYEASLGNIYCVYIF